MGATRKSLSTDAVAVAVDDCLARHVGKGDQVAVALSGGLDSVVLLHALNALGRQVSAVHVHHGLSRNADRWAVFCREICQAWAVPFSLYRVEVERGSGDGLEAAARRARHACYRDVPADWIGLAHHRDDRAETMLFNILRGAGVQGAGAMPERNGRLLRPMLDLGRSEIAAYAQSRGLRWIEDESNRDLRFSRNFLRHDVLPAIGQRFPAAGKRLARAAARFAEAASLLDDLAELDLGDHPPAFPLSLELLQQLPEPRARNILRFLLARHQIGIPSEQRLTEALRQFMTAAADRHPAVVFGTATLRRQGRFLALAARNEPATPAAFPPEVERVRPPT